MMNPTTTGASFIFGFKLGLCFAWGMPIIAVAIVLGLSIIGIPVAIALLPIAAYPMKHVIETRNKRIAAWELRDHPLEEGEVPWEM